jgi:CoA:oxalate CoA-transferase
VKIMPSSSHSSDIAQTKPLKGIRILDFTRVLAGPYCTALLADMGAEVIKVEALHGDDYRHIGPFVEGESTLFLLNNRNKKSITLDLKSDAGLKIARDLAQKSDVVIENFKPGVAERLGIGYEDLSRDHPALIYASISGFGQTGPMADRPAFDMIAQAMSGLMSITGEADGPPMRMGESFGDICAGLYCAWAIMTALYARQQSDQGTHIDVAMFDSLFSMMPTALAQYISGGPSPTRVGNHHPLSTPFGAFQAKDGHIIIATITNTQFKSLCDILGCAELIDDPRFASDELRTINRDSLIKYLEARLIDHKVEDMVARLNAARVAASPIWSVDQAIRSQQVDERGLFPLHQHPVLGEIPVMEQPVHFSNFPRNQQAPAPQLGEHSDDIILNLLGMDQADLDELKRQGIIKTGTPND